MDNKDKEMIEEMAKEQRVAQLDLFYNFCKYNGCEEKTAEDCVLCYFRKVYDMLAKLEDKIRNGTLKEIDKYKVVLDKEEYERLEMDSRLTIFDRIEICSKAEKRTAEKILKEAKELDKDFEKTGLYEYIMANFLSQTNLK